MSRLFPGFQSRESSHQGTGKCGLAEVVSVQFLAASTLSKVSGANLDRDLIETAAILTGLGMGTAFGLLIVLMILVFVVRQFSERVLDRGSAKAAADIAAATQESQNKAQAAVAAVTTLLAQREETQTSR